jgi:hypothetical protein
VIPAIRRALGIPAPRTWEVGWCVRLDWPDGSHDLTAYRADAAPAVRAATVATTYWSHSPVRPVSCTVVPVSRHDWRLHRDRGGCRAPDCPDTAGRRPVDPRRRGAGSRRDGRA